MSPPSSPDTDPAASRSGLELRPLRAIFLVSLLVPLYFLLLGYFGDDYTFHLSSWMGMLEGWRAGVPAPAWFGSINFGLGEPRFYFYPPVSVFCGALMLAVFPARIVPTLMPWLAVVVAGLSMLRLARHIHPQRATHSALLYCTSFYLVITLVMRYAIAELFVAAILPLIVLHAIRLLGNSKKLLSPAFTVLLAFAWLTNIPAALVVFYVMLLATLFLSAKQRSPRPLLVYLAAQGLAIGLSAWYLIPAALAQGQLTAVSLASKFPWKDYTLFHHPQNPLARSLTYPLWLWAIAGFLFILIFYMRRPNDGSRTPALPFIAILGCIPLLFELPLGVLWNHLPELKLVAFSFRFLPFVAIALSLQLPQVRKASLRRAAYALWIVWMLLPVAERIGRSRVHGAPAPFATIVAQIEAGTSGMSEYLPRGVDSLPTSKAATTSLPPATPCETTNLRTSPQARQADSSTPLPCTYAPGLFFFPEWHATVDHQPAPIERSPTGLIQLQVPAGDHHIEVYFQRPPQPLLLGLALTLLAIVLLLSTTRRPSKQHSSTQPA